MRDGGWIWGAVGVLLVVAIIVWLVQNLAVR